MDLRTTLDTALGNSCRIVRELGGGGMSRVFLAEDTDLGREIVVKVIPSELVGQVNVERFRREIQVAARLQHPCIVPVLSAGIADGLPYYTMPFVEGESLRGRLSREKGLSLPETVRILRDVAGALAYAHEHGVVHRDIKPENILVTKHHAVLADFGVAKALTDSTRGGATLTSIGIALGTPAYMSPEQATADPSVDHRADIYALGVVAYEMIAGRHPFEGRSSQAMLAAHSIEIPTPLEAHRPNISPALNALITRMLQKHPGDRPQTADEILALLDQVTTPTTQTAFTIPGNAGADLVARRRKKLVAVSAGAGALVTLVALSLFAFQTGSGEQHLLNVANVLVLPPIVTDGGDASLSRESERIRDALMQELARVRSARLVNRPDQDFEVSLSPGEAGRRESAGTVVTSTVFRVGDSLEVRFKLVDANSDRVVRTLNPARIPRDPRDEELRNAIDPVLTIVGFATESSLGVVAIPLTVPRFTAFEEFETGVQLASGYDTAAVMGSVQHFLRAGQLDTGFIQSRLWLAWMLRSSGAAAAIPKWGEKFDSVQVYVRERRTRLSPFEADLAEFSAQRMATDRGVNALRKLIALVPQSPFRSDLAEMLLDLNRPYGADSAMTELLKSDSNLRSLPHYWLGVAALNHYTGDYRKALDAANKARKLTPSDISAFRPALAALAALGDTLEFERLVDDAAIASPNGTFFGFAGDLYLATAHELIAHGFRSAGERTLRRAIAWFDARTPAQMQSRSVALRAALGYISVDRLDEAEGILKEMQRTTPDVRILGALGRIAALRGDTSQAERYSKELAAMPADKLSGTSTFERAQIAAELNRREEAVSLLREAFGQGIGFGYRSRLHWFTNFMRMSDYPPFKALITPQG